MDCTETYDPFSLDSVVSSCLTPWEKEVLKMHWEDTSPKALERSGVSHPLLSPFFMDNSL